MFAPAAGFPEVTRSERSGAAIAYIAVPMITHSITIRVQRIVEHGALRGDAKERRKDARKGVGEWDTAASSGATDYNRR